MRLFVTGATGFIGSHFTKLALTQGHEVRALRRSGSHPRIPLTQEPLWIEGDLEIFSKSALSGCDALVHFAAAGVLPETATWQECFRWNVSASLQLWLDAVEAKVRTIIVCGSCFEYGRAGERYQFIPADAPLEPVGPYASSKAAASIAALALAEKEINVQVLRPFHVFGEGEDISRFWPGLRRAALSGEDFKMTEGAQVRDFIPVELVAEAFLRSTTSRPKENKMENLGTGCPQSLRQFAEHWWRVWDAKGKLIFGAMPYRANEVMRYVPLIPERTTSS